MSATRAYEHLTNLDKILLTLASIGAYGLWYIIAQLVQMPVKPHEWASIISGGPWIGIPALALGMVMIAFLATLLMGRIRFEAGLFCCAIGLVVIPARGGTIQDALLNAGTSSLYISLAIETAIVGAIIVGTYLLIQIAKPGFVLPPLRSSDEDPDTTSDRVTVVIAQAVCTLVMLMILCQSSDKGQTLAGVCLGAMLSAMFMHQTYVVRGAIWYIAGTMLAGAVAYVFTGLFSPSGFEIGEVRGLLAGAARPLPLHYASLGVAGTIFGYWSSTVWHAAKKARVVETQAA